jgi:hypothetical protein
MRIHIRTNLNFIAKIFFMLLAVLPLSCKLQNTQSNFDSSFNAFKRNNTSDFKKFQDRNDSIFIGFLQGAWKEFGVQSELLRNKIKPRIQPTIETRIKKGKTGIDSVRQLNNLQKYQIHLDSIPEKDSYNLRTGQNSFEFYGEKNNLPDIPDLVASHPVDNLSIVRFYRSYLKDPSFSALSLRLKMLAKDLKLNDYGYFILTRKASRKLLNDVNSQLLFTWVTLLRSGLDVKIGFQNDHIALLMACDHPVYEMKYITIGAVNYFIICDAEMAHQLTGLQTYDVNYPGKIKPVSLEMEEVPALSDKPGTHYYLFHNDTVKIDINLSLIDYLNNYPACDLDVYFNAPISEKALRSLDRKLNPILRGKSETAKVSILLSFIQESFAYKTDQEQFGKEKYMFCDEAVFYPFTDCDDRSILMARLVKHYTGLEAVGLNYPNHVSVGVKFMSPVRGDFVLYNNEKFVICDPTYIGAGIGMAMDEMKTSNPGIVMIRN